MRDLSRNSGTKAATISEGLLKKAGYYEYDEHRKPSSRFTEKFFQKKFADKHGTKYFIEIKYLLVPQNGDTPLHFWDFSMQIETEKGAMNFTTVQWFNQDGVYSGRTIPETEAYFEWLWIKHGKPYYELNP